MAHWISIPRLADTYKYLLPIGDTGSGSTSFILGQQQIVCQHKAYCFSSAGEGRLSQNMRDCYPLQYKEVADCDLNTSDTKVAVQFVVETDIDMTYPGD